MTTKKPQQFAVWDIVVLEKALAAYLPKLKDEKEQQWAKQLLRKLHEAEALHFTPEE